jgi:hypothetical protein
MLPQALSGEFRIDQRQMADANDWKIEFFNDQLG